MCSALYYDKEKYEKLILDSPLFEIDKETNPTLYDREKYRFVENLYLYLLSVNEKKYEPYSYEIFMLADSCIKAYSPNQGPFLNYFNAAWKKEQGHIFGDENLETQYRGLKIKEADIRKIRQIKKLIDEMRLDINEADAIQKISKIVELPKCDVETYFEMISTSVSDGYLKDSDGDEHNIIEQIADVLSVEDDITSKETIKYILDSIQELYVRQQQRSQPIISDYITTSIYPAVKEYVMIHDYSFFSDFAIYAFDKKNRLLTKREIAIRYNRNEASINRTIKKFLVELSDIIEGGIN